MARANISRALGLRSADVALEVGAEATSDKELRPINDVRARPRMFRKTMTQIISRSERLETGGFNPYASRVYRRLNLYQSILGNGSIFSCVADQILFCTVWSEEGSRRFSYGARSSMGEI